MRFRLLYEGPLRGNRRRSEEKDRIRLVFSRQLQQLWTDYLPLSSLRREAEHYSAREVGGRFFLPMAIKSLTFRCEVDILILSPSRDLGIIRNADIDNRVKTLIDALRLPTQRSEVSQVICENTVDHPVYVCWRTIASSPVFQQSRTHFWVRVHKKSTAAMPGQS